MSNADLSWMNVPGPDGLTFLQKYQQGKLPAKTGTVEQNNAFNELKRYLVDFKLDSLAEPLWKYIIDTGVNNDDQLWLWIQNRPEFHTRFPAFKKLQEQGRAISPAAYIELEKAYQRIMRASNIPSTFFDKPDDFTELIVADVSPAEFQTRVEKGYQRVAQSDSLIRNAFKSYFGIEGDAALAAFFIDPKRSAPALERAVKSAEVQSAALRSNTSVNLSYATKLADMGVSYEQALQGFQRLNMMRPLFEKSIGEVGVTSQQTGTSDLVNLGTGSTSNQMDEVTQQGVDYLFGTDVNTQKELERRLNQRKAQGAGETQQVVVNRLGRTGVGTAN